jgi:small subunit ribosomal protein S6
MQLTTKSLKEYETIYILRSDIDADAADKVANRVSEAMEREGGKILKFESWGRRRLAYPIAKQRKGVYVFVKYVGGGGLVAELERNLRLSDDVIKHLTVVTGIAPEQLAIDPEEAKFRRLELTPDEDDKISREKLLGFVDGDRREERTEDEFDAKDEEADPVVDAVDLGDEHGTPPADA